MELMDVKNTWETEKLLHAATGLTSIEAKELLIDFSNELISSEPAIDNEQTNLGGRPAKLDNKGLFLMLMLYYRHYPTLDLLAVVFEISTSNVKRWIDRSEEALRTVLAKKNFSHLIAPDQKKKSRKPLSAKGKSISMALSSLYVDPKTR